MAQENKLDKLQEKVNEISTTVSVQGEKINNIKSDITMIRNILYLIGTTVILAVLSAVLSGVINVR